MGPRKSQMCCIERRRRRFVESGQSSTLYLLFHNTSAISGYIQVSSQTKAGSPSPSRLHPALSWQTSPAETARLASKRSGGGGACLATANVEPPLSLHFISTQLPLNTSSPPSTALPRTYIHFSAHTEDFLRLDRLGLYVGPPFLSRSAVLNLPANHRLPPDRHSTCPSE